MGQSASKRAPTVCGMLPACLHVRLTEHAENGCEATRLQICTATPFFELNCFQSGCGPEKASVTQAAFAMHATCMLFDIINCECTYDVLQTRGQIRSTLAGCRCYGFVELRM